MQDSTRLPLKMLPQPDETTCGPTCLHAIYNYYDDTLPLEQLIADTRALEEGGTLDVFLASHALRRGYRATIYTYNVKMFDPSWFAAADTDIGERLERQLDYKPDPKLRVATRGYQEFFDLGGRLLFSDLNPSLIRGYLKRAIPILTGLSATYLYRTPREYGENDDYDDVRGEPSGHFVVLCGYDRASRSVLIADPLRPSPVSETGRYAVSVDRVIGAILLGILTYDANLLIIEPVKRKAPKAR